MQTIKSAFLLNPPGRLFQRGEDRSQGNIEDSAATSLRAPNDLAYMAAMLRMIGINPVIRDYPAEQKLWPDYESDFAILLPDILIMSVTSATIYEDLRAFNTAKRIKPETITIAKGALFLSVKLDFLEKPVFRFMDYALTGESETIINNLLNVIMSGNPASAVNGIIFRDDENKWKRTLPETFVQDLDAIPFPARDLLKNELYVRPDTGDPQATIQTSRGCSGSCIFCLTPVITGRMIRLRSAKNIVDEIQECMDRYHIRNFFFKSDTFTMNKTHVIELCKEIIDRKLNIEWVANSRVDTLDEERIDWMKRAGCWLVAIGFENGDDDSLKKMKKHTTAEQAMIAVRLIRKFNLQLYGFFMIGMPWENRKEIAETIRFANALKCDYAEIHIAVPYEGTELYDMAESNQLIEGSVQGHDYFRDPVMKSFFLTRKDIMKLRKNGLKKIYLSPVYIWNRLNRIKSPRILANHIRYGLRLIRQLL